MPPGKEGDIGVRIRPARPVGLFREYWKNARANRELACAATGTSPATAASMDEDGYFWFVGRADDVIISAGYRIGPFEVESALLEHAAVVESAVVVEPRRASAGEIVKAFVVLEARPRASDELAAELQEHVQEGDRAVQVPARRSSS